MEKRFSIRIDGKWECGCHFWDLEYQSFSLFSLIALRNCVQPSSGTFYFFEATQLRICLSLFPAKSKLKTISIIFLRRRRNSQLTLRTLLKMIKNCLGLKLFHLSHLEAF